MKFALLNFIISRTNLRIDMEASLKVSFESPENLGSSVIGTSTILPGFFL